MSNLKNLEFSDLIVGGQGAFLKGCPGRPELCGVQDADQKSEINEIWNDLQQKQENEFLYCKDGIQYRVARMKTVDGTWFTLRKGMQKLPSLAELGLPKPIIDTILDSEYSHGLLLFSGEMGSGKTTSASAYVGDKLCSSGGHAVTLEDPPELPLQGAHGAGVCFQQEVKDKQFAEAVVSAMRYASPKIIFLGELRESASVSEALRAAINGHIIVATIHAAGIIETLDRLRALAKQRDGDAANNLLASGLFGIIHQRLVEQKEKKKLKTKVLFAKKSISSIRSKIREGQIHQLNTEIQQQQNELFMGKK